MFGFVSHSELAREQVARAAAEAEAKALRERVSSLESLLGEERTAFAQALQDARAHTADFLDRVLPKREQFVSQESPPSRRPYTAEMARRIPAIGKADMHRRRQEVAYLEAEERAAEAGDERGRREVSLSDEERRSQGLTPRGEKVVDELLGIQADAFPKTPETEEPEVA